MRTKEVRDGSWQTVTRKNKPGIKATYKTGQAGSPV